MCDVAISSGFEVFNRLHVQKAVSENEHIYERQKVLDVMRENFIVYTLLFNNLLFTLQMYIEQYYSELNNSNLNLIKHIDKMSQCLTNPFPGMQSHMPPSQLIIIHSTHSTEKMHNA